MEAQSPNPVTENSENHHYNRKQVLISFGVLALLIVATIFVVLYGRGYRLSFGKGTVVAKTGVLHLMSTPKSAQVFLNDRPSPTTVTEDTLNLTPGKYKVKIAKEGYNDWQKDVQIETEVVTTVEATLFPKAPTLQSISTYGVKSAFIDPTGTKLAFKISSQSARKNGIYVFDMTARVIPVLVGQSNSIQLVDDTINTFSRAKLSWSPDGKQLLAGISDDPTLLSQDEDKDSSSSLGTSTYYLLKADGFNENPQDATPTLSNIRELWRTQRLDKETARLKSLKPKVAQFAKQYFNILSWSPDDKKILYQAADSAQMPIFLKPRRIGNNLLYERRDLKKGAIYVYDITEDMNTRLIDTMSTICSPESETCTCTEEPQEEDTSEEGETCINPFTWSPDSEHLVYLHEGKIDMVENDGSNMTTIYAGPFLDHYVFPWSDGSKLVILTNLNNPAVSPTLYTIGLK